MSPGDCRVGMPGHPIPDIVWAGAVRRRRCCYRCPSHPTPAGTGRGCMAVLALELRRCGHVLREAAAARVGVEARSRRWRTCFWCSCRRRAACRAPRRRCCRRGRRGWCGRRRAWGGAAGARSGPSWVAGSRTRGGRRRSRVPSSGSRPQRLSGDVDVQLAHPAAGRRRGAVAANDALEARAVLGVGGVAGDSSTHEEWLTTTNERTYQQQLYWSRGLLRIISDDHQLNHVINIVISLCN
jgi:hypothetical protein